MALDERAQRTLGRRRPILERVAVVDEQLRRAYLEALEAYERERAVGRVQLGRGREVAPRIELRLERVDDRLE